MQARAWLEHARKNSRAKVAWLENRSKIFGSKTARLENRSKIFRSKMARLENCSNSSQIQKMKTEFSLTLLSLWDCCMYVLLRSYVFGDLWTLQVNETCQKFLIARALLEHARKNSRSKVTRLQNRSKFFCSKIARLENRSKIFGSKTARLEHRSKIFGSKWLEPWKFSLVNTPILLQITLNMDPTFIIKNQIKICK